MLKVILLSLVMVPSLSFARGPGMSAEAESALEACGISKPERGERPSREEHEAIKDCLDEAGVEAPRKRDRRSSKYDRESESHENGSIS